MINRFQPFLRFWVAEGLTEEDAYNTVDVSTLLEILADTRLGRARQAEEGGVSTLLEILEVCRIYGTQACVVHRVSTLLEILAPAGVVSLRQRGRNICFNPS